MTAILVRKLRFAFDEPIELDVSDADLPMVLGSLGLSLTMPYLEPYLIRTLKTALNEIDDPRLAADVRSFSQQESHHYRNHALFNEQVRGEFDAEVARELLALENALEADYQRFTQRETLRFNLAYAEGFEAMTCAFALASAEHGAFERLPGREMFAWHMAEEIEHRTVAFEVFEQQVGSYGYRMTAGTWSQWHYAACVYRLANVMARAIGRRLRPSWRPLERTIARNYLRTWSPRYHPARLDVPPGVAGLLEHYTARAAAS